LAVSATEADGTDSQEADVDAVSDKTKDVVVSGNGYHEQRW